MLNPDKQHINLRLDAHSVGLDVPRDQEPNYRAAAELLNKRYQYYLKLRPNASAEQLWMYTALEVAVALQSDVREKSLVPVEKEKFIEEGNAAVRMMAEQEGLFLDPVYTGKAFGGLIAMAREGAFTKEDNVLFLHSGGAGGLFAVDF